MTLSTGIALPQTGPDGTLMGFSVDYEFAQTPSERGRHALLVERRDGNSLFQITTLGRSGNVSFLAPGWRPEDGPFQGFLVELGPGDAVLARSDAIELALP